MYDCAGLEGGHMKLEYRAFQAVELRMENEKTMCGYAAVFNCFSENLGGFRERIAQGAFSKTITDADVRLLVNHEGLPLARTRSNTLKLEEDEKGLYFKADIEINDPDVQRILPKMKRGDLDQMSFGFYIIHDKWEEDKLQNDYIRTLLEVRLFDISIVTYPAYPQTSVNIRSAKETYDAYLASLQTQNEAIKTDEEQKRTLEFYRQNYINLLEKII